MKTTGKPDSEVVIKAQGNKKDPETNTCFIYTS